MKALYWATTAVVVFVLCSGGAAQLFHQHDTVANVLALGYPLYFVTLLGALKLAGGIVIALPGLPRLKEFAYAGAVFDLGGAAYSHAAAGTGIRHVVVPALFALLALGSWAIRPANRRLA
ncbi:MAG: DoxX family protein [Kofleriaceae bacterium]